MARSGLLPGGLWPVAVIQALAATVTAVALGSAPWWSWIHLGFAPLVVVATPAYLAQMGTPRSPQDLAQHECIQFTLPSTGLPIPWALRVDGVDVDVATQGALSCSGDVLATVTLVRAGAGLLQTYRFIVEDDLRTGALVEVLPHCAVRSRPFSLLYPQNRHMPRRVRVFVDFLTQALAP